MIKEQRSFQRKDFMIFTKKLMIASLLFSYELLSSQKFICYLKGSIRREERAYKRIGHMRFVLYSLVRL